MTGRFENSQIARELRLEAKRHVEMAETHYESYDISDPQINAAFHALCALASAKAQVALAYDPKYPDTGP